MIIDSVNIIVINGLVSTDDIIPAQYKHRHTSPLELSKHVFEYKIKNIREKLQQGTVIICDSTFGIGSSREQAVSALLAAGVVAILAPGFGRIFFRNSWNIGLISIDIDTQFLLNSSQITIDMNEFEVRTKNKTVTFPRIPLELINMYQQGGLLESAKNSYFNTMRNEI